MGRVKKSKKSPVPNPGSDEALDMGCICPVLDNSHGKGYMGQENVFIYTIGCPIHYSKPIPDKKPRSKRKIKQKKNSSIPLRNDLNSGRRGSFCFNGEEYKD